MQSVDSCHFIFFMVARWPAYLSNISDESLHVYFASHTHKNKEDAVSTEERCGWGSCGYTQIARIQKVLSEGVEL